MIQVPMVLGKAGEGKHRSEEKENVCCSPSLHITGRKNWNNGLG